MKSLLRNPWPLWLIGPVMMYWIGRVWMKAKRGELSEGPVVFTLRDRIRLFLGMVVVGLLAAASFMRA